MTRGLDNEIKDTRNPFSFFLARVPVMSAMVPGKVDLWGNPVTYDNFLTPEFADPITGQDRISVEMRKVGVKIPEARRVVSGTPMSVAEYQQMRVYAGQGDPANGVPSLRESIKSLVDSPTYKKLQHEEAKASAIQAIISSYNQFARFALMQDSRFTFGQRYMAELQARGEKLQ